MFIELYFIFVSAHITNILQHIYSHILKALNGNHSDLYNINAKTNYLHQFFDQISEKISAKKMLTKFKFIAKKYFKKVFQKTFLESKTLFR